MNYTEKYHLPQWDKSDRIMMEDFNQMCADMEAGLNKAAAATAKVQTDAASALAAVRTEAASAAANAQNSANAAQASADAARAVADAAFCPGYMPYATGTYNGKGSMTEATKIATGFRPRLIIIMIGFARSNSAVFPNIYMAAENTAGHGLTFLDDGFSVCNLNNSFPDLNNTSTYSYIAFR